jgi:hypothetical protein
MTQSERNTATNNYLGSIGFDLSKMQVITTRSGENAIYAFRESELKLTKKLSAFLRDLGYVIHLESNSKYKRP